MSLKKEFKLEDFIGDSLNLQTNILPQTKIWPTKNKQDDRYAAFASKDPLDLLGETTFSEGEPVPEKVIGTPVQEFYRGLNVFITGGTGFVGKLLIEKLVRSLPHLGHIYVLIRTKRGKTVQERFDLLLNDKVFRRMRTEVPWWRSKLSAVSGDLSQTELGLSAADRLLLTEVHVVIHSAADVKFIDPLTTAVAVNVLGSRRVLQLAKQMTHIKAYIHVSTAFSQCSRRVISESVPQMSIPYKEILDYIQTRGEEMTEEEVTRTIQGWPNTYTFSKALAELVVEEESAGLPVCIFRPSIIFPTYKSPVRGWTDNLYGPVALMIGAALGVIHSYHMDDAMSLDTVPADYVANAIIVAAWDTLKSRSTKPIKIINFTSPTSPERNWNWKKSIYFGNTYGHVFPFIQAIWCFSLSSETNPILADVKHLVLNKAPAYIIDSFLRVMGQKPRLMKAFSKMEAISPSFDFFLFTQFEFINENASKLWCSLCEEDKSIFYFNTRDVDFLELLFLGQLGIRYYYFKEDMSTLPAARRKFKCFYWIHNLMKITFWFGVLCLTTKLARTLPL